MSMPELPYNIFSTPVPSKASNGLIFRTVFSGTMNWNYDQLACVVPFFCWCCKYEWVKTLFWAWPQLLHEAQGTSCTNSRRKKRRFYVTSREKLKNEKKKLHSQAVAVAYCTPARNAKMMTGIHQKPNQKCYFRARQATEWLFSLFSLGGFSLLPGRPL